MTIYINTAVLEPGDIFYAADKEGLVAAFQISDDGDISEIDLPDAIHQRFAAARDRRNKSRTRDRDEIVEAFENGETFVVVDDEDDRP